MSVKDSYQCACNDNAYRIPSERLGDTWQSEGFWCSTTMSLLNYDGQTKFVWNPYSLFELESILKATTSNGKSILENYLDCLSRGQTCSLPSNAIFDRQQISILAVYQRCLANYQMKQWDSGTYALWDPTIRSKIPVSLPIIGCIPLNNGFYDCLGDCLLQAQIVGSSNGACFDQWLHQRNILNVDYFQYVQSNDYFVHACQVFSGPAKLPTSEALSFRHCLDEYSENGMCKLPNIIWSGRSTNKVPVANDHATFISDQSSRIIAAQNEYISIQNDVLDALNTMANWTSDALEVTIFSSEGDMLHQYFDCMIMGAEGNMPLWPSPESTPHPIWSRQSDSSASREFELPCSGDKLKDRLGLKDTRAPFTCGSYSRRALIKYFLRNTLIQDPNANRNIVQVAVQNLVAKSKDAWLGDLSSFMCRCPSGEVDVSCCKLDPTCDASTKTCPCLDGSAPSFACCETSCVESTFLPERFQVTFDTVKGSDMVSTLFQQVDEYLATTVWKDNTPWLMYDIGGAESYNWTAQNLQTPLEEGAFDTTIPIMNYDKSEYGYPYRTTTYEMCMGLLQQIIFTMPMRNGKPTTIQDAYDPDLSSRTLNLSYQEEFVQKLSSDAFRKSPLYWHYIIRHKPSESLMCHKTTPKHYIMKNANTYPVFGYDSMSIGTHYADCYCGWWYNQSHCHVPDIICQRLILLLGSFEIVQTCNTGRIITPKNLHNHMIFLIKNDNGWQNWPCPALEISDMWGIMPNHASWMEGSSDINQVYNYILSNGTSGLRVGSLDWLKLNDIRHINPAARVHSIQPLQCDVVDKELIDNFIDDLFPAAQGVRVSALTSSCLRFAIEVARLTIFKEAGLKLAESDQMAIVGEWRKKCQLKISQATFCKVLGIFNISSVSDNCPFQINPAYDDFVVTSSCLIVYRNKVYDPCACNKKWCTPTTDLLDILDMTSTCEVAHIQDFVVDSNTRVPVFPMDMASFVPSALQSSSFFARVLSGSENVANNKGHWSTAEKTNFVFCDLIVDWWPEDWIHPVGYHVTVPCNGAAFRTFDASWSALKIGNTVKMIYSQHSFRNKTLQTNVFGASGLCRTHNVGMPMKVMNTIRYCTQTDERAVDPTVPGAKSSSANWGEEYCSTSPYEVPWDNGPTSVGTLFNYFVNMKSFDNWGEHSGHAPLFTCTRDADCCSTCKCFLSENVGICSKPEVGMHDCAQHQHCPSDKMCSGVGRCVTPVMEISNNRDEEVTIRVFSDHCANNPFDTWGTSKEELLPDVMSSSGMCSYRSWFEQRNLKKCTSNACTLNSTDLWMFSSPEKSPNNPYESGILKLQSHPCDRSYEHLDKMFSCNPLNTLLRDSLDNTVEYQKGSITQTYRNNKELPVVKHDWSNSALGFLGFPKSYRELGYKSMQDGINQPKLRPCASFGLCSTQSGAGYWSVNGRSEQERYFTIGSWNSKSIRPSSIDDITMCGGMGFIDTTSGSGHCRLDAAVVPLFYYYCSSVPKPVMCSSYVDGLYAQGKSTSQLQTMADQLNSLFEILPDQAINTFSQYISAVEKAKQIWDFILNKRWLAKYQSSRVDQMYSGNYPKGLYYLMTYSAYEFPFSWWWRCTWLSNIIPSGTYKHCLAWEESKTFGYTFTGDFSFDDPIVNENTISIKQWLARIPGIYVSTHVLNQRIATHNRIINLLNSLNVPTMEFACFNSASYNRSMNDTSYDEEILRIADSGDIWSEFKTFRNCKGRKQCLIHNNKTIDASKNIVHDIIESLKYQTPCHAMCVCTNQSVSSKCTFSQDSLIMTSNIDSDVMNKNSRHVLLFEIKYSDALRSNVDYSENIDGCATVYCCAGNLNCYGNRRLTESECQCLKENPSESEIEVAGLNPKPSEKPWLVLSNDNAEKQIPDTDHYLFNGPDYVAINLCQRSHLRERCTFADDLRNDDCTTRNTLQKQRTVDLYCTEGRRQFENIDKVYEVCTAKLDGTNNLCFGSTSLSNKYIQIPNALNMLVTPYVIPEKRCWTLTCPSPGMYAQFNGQTIFEATGFDDQLTFRIKVLQGRQSYTSKKRVRYTGFQAAMKCGDAGKLALAWLTFGQTQECYVLEDEIINVQISFVSVYAWTKSLGERLVMTFETNPCDFSQRALYVLSQFCHLNSKMTRSTSLQYTTPQNLQRHAVDSVAHMTDDQIFSLVIKTISLSEDFVDTSIPTPVCLTKEIDSSNLRFCINDKFSITKSRTASIQATNDLWNLRFSDMMCHNIRYTDLFKTAYCQSTMIQDDTCIPVSFHQEVCHDRNDPYKSYSLRVLNMWEWEIMMKFSGYEVLDIEYTGVIDEKCNRTEKTCFYNEEQESRHKDYGLPNIGFCPSCNNRSSTVGFCETLKRTTTYNMVRTVMNSNEILPVTMSSSLSRTPDFTRHIYMELQPLSNNLGIPMCNLISCPKNKYKVEIFSKMFVCINCKLISPIHCSGKHMCSFNAWNWPAAPLKSLYPDIFSKDDHDFDTAYSAVRANILALLPTKVNVQPIADEMLDSFRFVDYNPEILKSSYNVNMELMRSRCAAETNLPIFSNCQNDGPRQTLKSFVELNYKPNDGSKIPGRHVFSWEVNQEQLLHTNLVTWFLSQRNSYFQTLFNDDLCRQGNIANLICFRDTTVNPPLTLTTNPVLSGNFEVQEGCDVTIQDSTRVIDSLCNDQTCPNIAGSSTFDQYNTFEGSDFNDLNKQTSCKTRNNNLAQYLSTPSSFPTNMCAKKPSTSRTCNLDQGMIGHIEHDGESVTDLYSRLSSPVSFLPQGLLGGQNPILRGETVTQRQTLGNISLHSKDIGGNYIRMRLDGKLLKISGYPLQAYSSLMEARNLQYTPWLENWQMSRQLEHNAVSNIYMLKTCQSHDCPLRRRYFWSGRHEVFRPQTPNPLRSHVLYGHHAHPTTFFTYVPDVVFPVYRTKNGFCLCHIQAACSPTTGSCSLADTINSLIDLEYRSATVIESHASQCDRQTDWPLTGGSLRDNTIIPNRINSCGMLSRLPNFVFRYHNSREILSSTTTTLDEGGDCHMGRPAEYSSTAEDCLLLEKNDTHLILKCNTQNVTLNRPKTARLSFQSRATCEMCDPIPKFYSSTMQKLNYSEVSYGQPWRIAPARKLAQDIRFRLCGNATECPHLKIEKFNLESFWDNMMEGGLVGNKIKSFKEIWNNRENQTSDTWEREPWMLCTTTETETRCEGSASKLEWLNNSSGTCSAIQNLPNAVDAIANLSVCDLDQTLDNLCRVIQNARYRLFEANCKLSGSCRTTSFFYQPATFSVSNDQLSRQTVQYFYSFVENNSCPAMTIELAKILQSNRKTAQECSSQSLEFFHMAINSARQSIQFFVKIAYYMLEIWLHIISLLTSKDHNPIITRIFTYFTAIMNEFKQFFMTLGDTLYKMIMETGQLGKFIRDMAIELCKAVSWLIDNLIKPWLCFY